MQMQLQLTDKHTTQQLSMSRLLSIIILTIKPPF